MWAENKKRLIDYTKFLYFFYYVWLCAQWDILSTDLFSYK